MIQASVAAVSVAGVATTSLDAAKDDTARLDQSGVCGDWEARRDDVNDQELREDLEDRISWLLSWHGGRERYRLPVTVAEPIRVNHRLMFRAAGRDGGAIDGLAKITDRTFGMISVWVTGQTSA